jgi:hypothetical protein
VERASLTAFVVSRVLNTTFEFYEATSLFDLIIKVLQLSEFILRARTKFSITILLDVDLLLEELHQKRQVGEKPHFDKVMKLMLAIGWCTSFYVVSASTGDCLLLIFKA